MNDHIDNHEHSDHEGAPDGEIRYHDHGTPQPRSLKNRPPTGDPENMAEQLVSPSLRGRESKCSANCGNGGCGSDGGACMTGGCGTTSLVELIVNAFVYDDDRRIIEVTYTGNRKEFCHVTDPEAMIRVHDVVLVESEKGIEIATVSMTGSLVHAKRKAKKIGGEVLPTLLRKINKTDLERHNKNHQAEREAVSVCRSRIEAFNLPMHLVEAEWQFDHRRITFFFTADGRVDFRELVRDLASIFHTRIELRQIAVRDEAKRMGGMGICGKELCCTTFLGRYEHITLDHAKAQQLQINPTKLSGLCGRLKCCLLYELDNYIDALKRFPPLDSVVVTEMGEGVIQKIDIFKDTIVIFHHVGNRYETLTLDELKEVLSRTGDRTPAVEAAPQGRRR
jgi:cell fate regulator YaaT (PSP1 superfamily)